MNPAGAFLLAPASASASPDAPVHWALAAGLPAAALLAAAE